MKINTHLLNLVQQILAAQATGQVAEEARLRSHAMNDIINNKYKHDPASAAIAKAAKDLEPILNAFTMEK